MVSVRIKPIIPKTGTLDLQQIAQTELRREVAAVKRELAFPTRTWKHRVVFYEQQATGAQSSGIDVVTDDKPYGWLDRGTKPHVIRPKKAKFLRFNSQFRAKTKPNSLNASAGASAPPEVFTQVVKHPGTKKRGFTTLVLKRSKPRFKRNMDKAIALAVARANRGK